MGWEASKIENNFFKDHPIITEKKQTDNNRSF